MPRPSAKHYYGVLNPELHVNSVPVRTSIDSMDSFERFDPPFEKRNSPTPHEGLSPEALGATDDPLFTDDPDREAMDVPEMPLVSGGTAGTEVVEGEESYLKSAGFLEPMEPIPRDAPLVGSLEGDISSVPGPSAVPEAAWATQPFTTAPGTKNRPRGSARIVIPETPEVPLLVTHTFSEELGVLRSRVVALEARLSAQESMINEMRGIAQDAQEAARESETRRVALEQRITLLTSQSETGLKAWVRSHFTTTTASTSTAPQVAATQIITAAAPTSSAPIRRRRKDFR